MERTSRHVANGPIGDIGPRPLSQVFLNDDSYWSAVPSVVWEYRIGGYQVIKKWLSCRQHDLLGRPLTVDEARHVTNMVHRIIAIVCLQTH
jgi:hypothetical protein